MDAEINEILKLISEMVELGLEVHQIIELLENGSEVCRGKRA